MVVPEFPGAGVRIGDGSGPAKKHSLFLVLCLTGALVAILWRLRAGDEAPVLHPQASATEERAIIDERTLDEPSAATPAAESARTETPAVARAPSEASGGSW
jgi:hypothetical protein